MPIEAPYSNLEGMTQDVLENFFEAVQEDNASLAACAIQKGVSNATINAPCLIIVAAWKGKVFPGCRLQKVDVLFELQTYVKETDAVHRTRCAVVDDALFFVSPVTGEARDPNLKDLVSELNTISATLGLGINFAAAIQDPRPENQVKDDKWLSGRVLTLWADAISGREEA